MSAQHSQAPWEWRGNWLCAGFEMVLYYTNADDGLHANREPDKPLIAAAPDMLATLQMLAEKWASDSWVTDQDQMAAAVHAVIARTTGAA